MHFQALFYDMFRALSLIAWYADSPPTANHGMRLANCTDLSLACLTAGQNALNELHQRQGKEHIAEAQQLRSQRVKDAKSEEQQQSTSVPLYELSFRGTFNESVKINVSMDGRQTYVLDAKPEQLRALNLSFLPGMAAVLAGENDTAKKVHTTDPPGTGDRNGPDGSIEGKRIRINVLGYLARWSLTLLGVCTMLYCCYSYVMWLWCLCREASDGEKRQEPVSRCKGTFARAIKDAGRGHANRRVPVNRYREIFAKGVRNTGRVADSNGGDDLEGEWESE